MISHADFDLLMGAIFLGWATLLIVLVVVQRIAHRRSLGRDRPGRAID